MTRCKILPTYEAPTTHIWDNTFNNNHGLMHLHPEGHPHKQPQAWFERGSPECVYLAGKTLKIDDIIRKQRACLAFIFEVPNV